MARADVLEALATDHVLTHTQLKRYYRARREVLEKLPSTTLTVQPGHMRHGLQVDVTFYALSRKRLRDTRAGLLAHIAGTAELRHVLGVPADRWESRVHRRRYGEQPDACWWDEDGVENVAEYDSGTYTRGEVQDKFEHFEQRGTERVVWGVVSSVRARNLRLVLPAWVDVRVLRWWE